MIVNGRNGYKTPERIDKWTEKVVRLIREPEHRSKLGEEALKTAERHSVKAFGESVHEIYATVIAQRQQKEERDNKEG